MQHPEHVNAGEGHIVVQSHGQTATFSKLSYTYPLKLLSPRLLGDRVAVVYAMTYGGGLVGGDRVRLNIDIQAGTLLVFLTQGSTKVFKMRLGSRRASAHNTPLDGVTLKNTLQTMDVRISDDSGFFLLPDPVTCFRAASYTQKQIFHLSKNASVILLDWITSGRKSLGEEWVFTKYYSLNEVWIDGRRIARDALLLEEQVADLKPLPKRSLSDSLAPYSCYATVFLCGPLVQDIISDLVVAYKAITVFKRTTAEDLLWSLSPLTGNSGYLVRVAGKDTESVRQWIGRSLQKAEKLVGLDLYRKTFTL